MLHLSSEPRSSVSHATLQSQQDRSKVAFSRDRPDITPETRPPPHMAWGPQPPPQAYGGYQQQPPPQQQQQMGYK